MKKNIAFIILAAGQGKRLGGKEQKTIKTLLGKSIIKYIIETIKKINPAKIIIVVGFKKKDVINAVGNEEVEFVEQKQLLGTANAVLQAEKNLQNFNGKVIILCGDTPFISLKTLNMIISKNIKSSAACTILTAKFENPTGYGRIKRNSENNVIKIVEEANADSKEKKIKEINTGVYIFDKKDLFENLYLIPLNPVKNEYLLTDIIELFYKSGKKVITYITDKPKEAIGINTFEDFKKAEKYYNRRTKWNIDN
jgi:bifunctional UDP-N-acetylglucosamine pyrophosphorylase/glucosamine-1-phosphate N-acetyltransferase